MPKEITDIDELDKIASKATEIRIKRLGDIVKVKFRTKRYLYTIKLTNEEFEKIFPRLRDLGIEIKEF